MNFTRRILLLGAAILALGASPESLAADPGITTQISKLKQALKSEQGPDVKRLRAATSSLTQKLPAALAVPPSSDRQDYQVNSAVSDTAEADTAASATPPELTLTDEQRVALINAYQDCADRIDALARQTPFTAQAAEQIVAAVATLENFLARLNQLVPMKRTSASYLNAVNALVAEEQSKGH